MDTKKIAQVVNAILNDCPEEVKQYKAGNNGLLGTLTAFCIKRLQTSNVDTGNMEIAKEVVKHLKQAIDKKCSCGKNDAGNERKCQYQSEINDTTHFCTCCEDCVNECLEGI